MTTKGTPAVKSKPWLSGHCNPTHPAEIHRQCHEVREDGKRCRCACHTELAADRRMCACGHTIGGHFAEPYCPACAGDPCDLDFRDWLDAHDAEIRAEAQS